MIGLGWTKVNPSTAQLTVLLPGIAFYYRHILIDLIALDAVQLLHRALCPDGFVRTYTSLQVLTPP